MSDLRPQNPFDRYLQNRPAPGATTEAPENPFDRYLKARAEPPQTQELDRLLAGTTEPQANTSKVDDTPTVLTHAHATIEDWPTPDDSMALRREFGRRNVFFNASDEPFLKDARRMADVQALQVLAELELYDPTSRTASHELDSGLFKRLSGALYANTAFSMRTPTGDELAGVQQETFRRTMRRAQQEGIARLNELQAKGETDTPEFRGLQQDVARAKSFESRADDPVLIHHFSVLASSAHESAASHDTGLAVASVEVGAERRITSRLWDEIPVRSGRVGARDSAKIRDLRRIVGRLVDPSNPTVFSDLLVAESGAALIDTRSRFMGADEDAAGSGPVALLARTHRNLVTALVDRSVNAKLRRRLVADSRPLDIPSLKDYKDTASATLDHLLRVADAMSPGQRAMQIRFDPDTDSFTEAVADTIDGVSSFLGVAMRSVYEGVVRAQAASDVQPSGSMRPGTGPTRRKRPEIPVDQLRAVQVTDILSGRVPDETVAALRTTPHVTSFLREQIPPGSLTFGEFQHIMNPNEDSLLALALVNSPAKMDAAAQAITAGRNLGLSVDVIRAQAAEAVRSVVEEGLAGVPEGIGGEKAMRETLKDARLSSMEMYRSLGIANDAQQSEDALAEIARARAEGREPSADAVLARAPLEAIKAFVHLTRWGAHKIGNETRQLVSTVTSDPTQITTGLVIGLAFTPVAMPLSRAVGTTINTWQASTATMLRVRSMRRALSRGAAASTTVTNRVVSALKDLGTPDTNGVVRRVDALTDAAEELARLHKEDRASAQAGTSPDTPSLLEAERNFRRALSGTNESELVGLLEASGAPLEWIETQFIQRARSVTGELMRGFLRKVRAWGEPLPGWIPDAHQHVFRAMRDAVDNGTVQDLGLEDVTSLLSHRGAAKLQQHGGLQVAWDKITHPRRRARLERTTAGQADYQFIGEFFGRVNEFKAFQDLAVERRGAASSFLHFVMNGRRRRAAERQIYGADPAPDLEVARRAEEAIRQSTDIKLSERVTFGDHPVLEDTNLEDILAWSQTQSDVIGDLYSRMSREFESRTAFTDRVRGLEGDSLREFKREFAKEYLDAPGIEDKFGFDEVEEVILSKGEMKTLKKRRSIAARHEREVSRLTRKLDRLERDENVDFRDKARLRKALQAKLDTHKKRAAKYRKMRDVDKYLRELEKDTLANASGITASNVGDSWKELSRLADFETSNDLAGMVTQIGAEGTGDFMNTFFSLQGAAVQTAAIKAAYKARIERLAMAAAGEGPEFQEALNLAFRAQEKEGDYLPMEELRKRYPHVFRGVPEDFDANIQYMLTEDARMRRTFGGMLLQTGAIDEDEYAGFVAPFVPRRYAAYDRLYTTARLQDETAEPPGLIGLTADELKARKDLTQWRLIVRSRNGAPTDRLFPDRDAALAYVKKNLTTDLDTRKSEFEGTTAVGDKFQVLAPVGREKANLLGILPETASLIDAYNALTRSAATANISRIIDRPGLTYTPQQWERFIKTPEGKAAAADFTAPLVSDKRFGRLVGRRIHKDAWNFLREAMDISDDAFAFRQALDAAKEVEEGLMLRAMNGTGHGLKTTAKFFKQVVSAQIFRSLSAHLTNLLSDYTINARMATDRGWHFSGRARRARADAYDILWNPTLENLRKHDVEIKNMERLGIFDDTMAGPMLRGGAGRAWRELLHGKDARGTGFLRKLKRFQFLDSRRGQDTSLTGAAAETSTWGDLFRGRLLGDHDPPAIRSVRARVDQIQDAMDGDLWPTLSGKEQLALTNELEDKMEILRRDSRGILDTGAFMDGLGWFLRAHNGSVDKPQGFGAFRDHTTWSADRYQRLGNWNRVSAYLYNRSNGMTPEAAAQNVNTFMQTYSGVPQPLQDFSNSFMGSPVLSFPWEFIRTSTNGITQKPALWAGIFNTLPVMNIASLAMSGADPEAVLETLSGEAGGLPAWTLLYGGMVVSDGKGGFSYQKLPMWDPFQLSRELPGVVNSLTEGIMNPDTISGQLGQGVLNTVNRTFLNNPVVSLSSGVVFNRDPISGKPYRSRVEGLLSTGHRAIESVLPPHMIGVPGLPVSGRTFSSPLRAAAGPENKLSGRVDGVLDRFMGSLLGSQIRGAWNDQQFEPFARSILFLSGDPDWSSRQLRSTGGFTDADLKSTLLLRSRRVDPDAPSLMFTVDLLERDLRAAVQTGDKKRQLEVQNKIRDRHQTLVTLGTDEKVLKMSDEELQRMVNRVVDIRDWNNAFRAQTIPQKAWMLGSYAGLAKTPRQVQEMLSVALTTPRGEFVTGGNSPAKIEQAIQFLDTFVQSLGRVGADRERIYPVQTYRNFLAHVLPGVRVRWAREKNQRRTLGVAHEIVTEAPE